MNQSFSPDADPRPEIGGPSSYRRIVGLLFGNRSFKQTLIKNAAWILGAEAITRLLSVGFAVLLARILGAENYGLLAFGISFTGLFSVISSFGIDAIIVREINQRDDAVQHLGAVMALKIGLGLSAAILIVACSFGLQNEQTRSIVMVFAIATLMKSISTFFAAIFQGLQRMEYVGALYITEALVLICGGSAVLFSRPSALLIAYVYVVAPAIVVLIGIAGAKHLAVLTWPVPDVRLAKRYLALSWPLALSSAFASVYIQIGTVMMGARGMMEDVGIYQAAYRIANFVLVLAKVVTTVFYPVISRAYTEDAARFSEVIDASFTAMAFLAVPVVAGGVLLSQNMIVFLYGEAFVSASVPFKALICSSGFIFFIMIMNSVLIAAGHQKTIFWTAGVAAVVSLGLNGVLIPLYGVLGAAIASLVSYVWLFLLRFVALARIRALPHLRTARGPALAVGVMTVFLHTRMLEANLVIRIIAAALIYAIVFAAVERAFRPRVRATETA